jgi:hypothetical protein
MVRQSRIGKFSYKKRIHAFKDKSAFQSIENLVNAEALHKNGIKVKLGKENIMLIAEGVIIMRAEIVNNPPRGLTTTAYNLISFYCFLQKCGLVCKRHGFPSDTNGEVFFIQGYFVTTYKGIKVCFVENLWFRIEKGLFGSCKSRYRLSILFKEN